MAEVKWIKVTTDIFDDEKILMIEALPSSDSIIVIWFKLLCLAGKMNNDGVFMMNNRIAYTDEMLSAIFRRDIQIIRLALKVFEQYGMIEIVNDVITIPNWNKHQTLDAYEKKKERDRLYMQQRREKQRLLAKKSSDSQATPSSDVVVSEEEREEDIDIDNNIIINNIMLPDGNVDSAKSTQTTINYSEIVELYNSICVSFPKCKVLSDKRKKAIKARLKKFTLEDFKTVFINAENSDFLKGANNKNWSANFDWLIQDANFVKTLDGNYANTTKKASTNNKFHNFEQRDTDYDKLVASYYGV